MSSIEERLQILKMIEEGKISAGEGAELLRALDREGDQEPDEPLKGASRPRWFRVRVTDLASGKSKVSVNIPMGLVNAGIKMGARFAPDLEGVNFDEITEMINSGAQGKIVDVVDNEEGERVEIFVE
jgi:hypothetical protein